MVARCGQGSGPVGFQNFVAGPERNCLPQKDDRFGQPACSRQSESQAAENLGIVGRQFEGFFIALARTLVLARQLAGRPQIYSRVAVVRVQFERLLEECDTLVQPS